MPFGSWGSIEYERLMPIQAILFWFFNRSCTTWFFLGIPRITALANFAKERACTSTWIVFIRYRFGQLGVDGSYDWFDYMPDTFRDLRLPSGKITLLSQVWLHLINISTFSMQTWQRNQTVKIQKICLLLGKSWLSTWKFQSIFLHISAYTLAQPSEHATRPHDIRGSIFRHRFYQHVYC